jgi:hypothetical protein
VLDTPLYPNQNLSKWGLDLMAGEPFINLFKFLGLINDNLIIENKKKSFN